MPLCRDICPLCKVAEQEAIFCWYSSALSIISVLSLTLLCRLNKCGVISPRYDVKHGELEAWVARLLPSRLVSACHQDIWKLLRSRNSLIACKGTAP